MGRTEYIAAVLVFATAFGVYIFTSAPLIAAGDAGELVSAAWLLGVPHPPGYPLFCIMGKLFSLLPFGNIAYRMNIMSGFFSAVGVGLVCLTGLELARGEGRAPAYNVLFPAAAALVLAFTGTYWAQATSSEVYPLQLALSASAVYAAVRAGREDDFRYVYAACLLFGLSVAGHYTALLLTPALFAYIILAFAGRWSTGRAAVCTVFVMAGLSVFVYLVPRAAAGTAVNWGATYNLNGFVRHVTRATYGDLTSFFAGIFATGPVWYKSSSIMVAALAVLAVVGFLAAGRNMVPAKAKLLGAAAASATALFVIVLAAKGITAAKVRYFAGFASSGGWPVLLLLSAAGLVFLFVRRRYAAYLFGLTLAVTLAVPVYRTPIDITGAFTSAFSEKFFMLPLVIAAMLAAGLGGLALPSTQTRRARRAVPAAAGAVLLVFAAWLAHHNFRGHDQSGYYYAQDYSDNLLRGMEQGSVFMVEGDNATSLMAYQKFVEKRRADVSVYEVMANIFPPFDETIPIFVEGRRPMYHSEAAEPDAFPGIVMRLDGMLSRFPGPVPRMGDPWEYYNARVDRSRIEYADFATREIIANYLYFRGIHLYRVGLRADAAGSFEDALRAGYDMAWTHLLVGGVMRDYYGLTARALELFSEAISIAPGQPRPHIEKGRTLLMTGEPGAAADSLERARSLSPDNPEVYCLLADAMERQGDGAYAADLRKRCGELAATGGDQPR